MKKDLIAFIVIVLTILVFGLACNKDSLESTKEILNLKHSVSKWSNQINASISATMKKKLDSLLNTLDYSAARQIKLANEGNLIIIKLADKSSEIDFFLGFTEKDDFYTTVGLIKLDGDDLKNHFDIIEGFKVRGKLELGEKIEIYTLNNLPLNSFEGVSGGKIEYKRGESRKIISPATNREFNIAPACVDWYWVTYDPENGRVYSAEYLYTTCENGGGGGGGGDIPYNGTLTIGRLCADYNFQNVGASYTGTVNNLKWIFRSPAGVEYPIIYGSTCLSIANYNINTSQASIIFNEAFNDAVNEVTYELNANLLIPRQIQIRLKALTQANLAALKPGSTWSAVGACAGSIPVTTISNSNYCP